mgnify:CR=1 FL=1
MACLRELAAHKGARGYDRLKRGRVLLPVAGYLLAVLLLAPGCFWSAGDKPTPVPVVEQPAPAEPGAPAPELEAAYRAAQADPTLTELERVRAAVDTYFLLHYESRLHDRAFDLGIVVDTSTKEGLALRDYELGRLQYNLANWRADRTVTLGYEYHPTYVGIVLEGDKADVRVAVQADLRNFTPRPRSGLFGLNIDSSGDFHMLQLARYPTGWRITADEYREETRRWYPLGTDWALFLKRFPERSRPEVKLEEVELAALTGRREVIPELVLLNSEATFPGSHVVRVEGTFKRGQGDLYLALVDAEGRFLEGCNYVKPQSVANVDAQWSRFQHTFRAQPGAGAGLAEAVVRAELRHQPFTTTGRLVVPLANHPGPPAPPLYTTGAR